MKEFQFCLRCGGRLLQKGKRAYRRCASCGFEFYDQPKVGVTTIIVNEHGEVLLTKRARDPKRGMWGTPGGFVENNESAEDAARREVREELGIQLATLTYLGSYP